MRIPAPIETNIPAPGRTSRALDSDRHLVDVSRDWGVDAAMECGGAGIRPIWRLGDDATSAEQRDRSRASRRFGVA